MRTPNVTRHVQTELGWLKVTLVHRDLGSQRPSEYYAKARAYVSTPTDLDGMPDPADDRAWRRWRREQTRAQRAVLAAALPTLEELLTGAVGECDWRFSQNAGCSCGCSPGFRDAAHRALYHDGTRVDVYVTLQDPTRLSDPVLLFQVAEVSAEHERDGEPDPTLDARSELVNAAARARWGDEVMDDLADQVTALRLTGDEFVTWARRESGQWLADRAREAAAR